LLPAHRISLKKIISLFPISGEMSKRRTVAFEIMTGYSHLPKMIKLEREILGNWDHYWELAAEDKYYE
jgi:hypothetical protein